MLGDKEQREVAKPLVGEITRVLRVKGETIDFLEQQRSFSVRVPEFQARLIEEFLSEKEGDLFLWLYKTRRTETSPWRGVIIAGPFGEELKKDISLLDEEQRGRWFNRFLTPLSKIGKIEGINPIESLLFTIREGKEIGFEEIWQALSEEARREKEGERKAKQYDREIGSLISGKGISGEAAERHKKIGEED